MIRAHGGHAGCCLNWKIYDTGVNCELNEMHVKINVIPKISCYLERSVVTLKLCKEYLNTVTRNTLVLFNVNIYGSYKHEVFEICLDIYRKCYWPGFHGIHYHSNRNK